MKLLGLSSTKAASLGFNINTETYLEGHNKHDCSLNTEIFNNSDLFTTHAVNGYGVMTKTQIKSHSAEVSLYALYTIIEGKLEHLTFPSTYTEFYNYLKFDTALYVSKHVIGKNI